MADQHSAEDRSLRTLAGSLLDDAGVLLSQELLLARTEVSSQVGRGVRSLVLLLAGIAIAAVGLLGLGAATVLALTLVLPPWLAALAVGAGTALVGLIFAVWGYARLATLDLAPRRSLASLAETVRWLREALK